MLVQLLRVALVLYEDYGVQIGVSVALLLGGAFTTWKYRTNVFQFCGAFFKGENGVYEIIENALLSILWKMQADRAYLFEYRGYDARIEPIPYLYTDNTIEVISPASCARPEKDNLQGILLSSIPFWTERLSQDGEIKVSQIENLRENDETAYKILKDQCIESLYVVGLVDFRRNPVGFVGVDYCSRATEIQDHLMESLRCEALKIVGLLALRNKKKGKDKDA